MRVDHEIFQLPNPVELTLEQRATPEDYSREDLGETMAMWRVQTEGYKDGQGQLIGVVSSDAGFFDSPDTEWISGGVNSKGPKAVAIGRHGNFFHWGFAASPKYMTEEAKRLFVNAVHYIAKFAGQTPIARKIKGVAVRSSLDYAIEGMTEEAYAKTLAVYEGYREDDLKRKQAIQVRLDAGETISEFERDMLDRPLIEAPGRFERISSYLPAEVFEALGEDAEAIAAYLTANRGYIHPTGDWYELGIDSELQEFGIANDDPAFLQAAIQALADPDRSALARRLLERYTQQDFSLAAEWQTWFEGHRNQFFFCETAGYLWLVNTRAEQQAQPVPKQELKPNAKSPAVFAATSNKKQDGHTLVVEAAVLQGWHLYEAVPQDEAYTALSFELELPSGEAGEWSRPRSYADPKKPGLRLLEGDLRFECSVTGVDLSKGAVSALIKVRYQVCDDRMCMRPATKELRVFLN